MSAVNIFLLKCLCILVAVAVASPAPPGGNRIIEKLNSVPHGWHKVSAPDPSTVLDFWLAIRREDPSLLHKTVLEISTPGHQRYGRHLDRDELRQMLRPRETTCSKVISWLNGNGIDSKNIHDEGDDWLKFTTTIQKVENLLNTRFYTFANRVNGQTRIRTLQYSVPNSIARFIQMIHPTTTFGQPKPQNSLIFHPVSIDLDDQSAQASSECSPIATPTCLRELYGLGNRTLKAGNANVIGVSGYLEQYAQYRDLELFLNRYVPEAKGANFTAELIGTGENTQGSPKDSAEANLDIQYVVGLSHNASVFYYSTGGRGPLVPDLSQPTNESNSNEPYLEQLRYLIQLPNGQLPAVLTTSYGEAEQSLPDTFTTATCDLFAQLGARGVSIIFSSGDTGPGSSCQTNDGKNSTRFNPIYPASCPFVTSIGGTYSQNPERAVRFSSGGFSDRFRQPSYQKQAVQKYLSILGDRWTGIYNSQGRGFPDIAAQGLSYAVYDKGILKRVSGTSASAPTIAAIIAHLNEIRLADGKSVLGFLNPWIYASGYKGFTDIVDGGSTGCTGRDIYSGLESTFIPYASWNATEGWDPVTGLGTPNFERLSKLLP
ncbi:Tripeptidyl-peptidase sed2 [Myotisia sp. PD_48]|nr:Tripeptidyl-peptidase sed2 [Myotisia sp. PD_48]